MGKSKHNRPRKSGGQKKRGKARGDRLKRGEASSAVPESGGVMQSMRSGLKRAAGVTEPNEKESTLSKVIWGIAIAAGIAYVVYQYTR